MIMTGGESVTKSARKWQWYAAGGGAILLFAVLMGVRLGVPGKLFDRGQTAVNAIGVNMPGSEVWMNITQSGRKIGYAQRTYTLTETGSRFSENVFMQINTMGIVQPLTVRTTAEMKPDRTLSTFQFDLGSNLFRFTARGEVAGMKLTVRVGAPGEERLRVFDLKEAPYLGGGILESVGAGGLKPGERRGFPIFDPASLGQRTVQVTFLGEEPVMVMGKSHRARKLSLDFMGMKQFAWVDPDGAVLREEGILGIKMERVAREAALTGLEGAVSADLTEVAAIPSSRPIEAPAELKLLKIRLYGLPEGAFFLDGGRQTYRSGFMTIRRESPPVKAVLAGGAGRDFSASLKATLFIQADHPKIRQKLIEIISPGDTPEVKAGKIAAWVHGNLEKRPVLSVPNALETLENRVGDCNEHAVLLTAFARAAGIPADVEAGVVYLRGRFYYHAWNVLFLEKWGGWVTIDSVLGQMPADVTHIRFVRGDSDGQLDLVGLIGNLKIGILEMAR
jgi:hypothetical protein